VPRYVVTTRRELLRQGSEPPTALSAISSQPGVKVVGYANPNTIMIDMDEQTAERLRSELGNTYYIELEIRRRLQ
jgi:hypothetical protein